MAKIIVTVKYEFDRDALEDGNWDEREMRDNYPDELKGISPGLLSTSAAIMRQQVGDSGFVNNMEWLNDCADARLTNVEITR